MQGTILPGVTRSAVLELAKARGYTTEETDVPITQALEVRNGFMCNSQVVSSERIPVIIWPQSSILRRPSTCYVGGVTMTGKSLGT